MITPSDKEFQLTKLIKQGKATMDKMFIPLAHWIDEKYGVKTMNIIYDTIDNGQRPRLEIIFEQYSDTITFDTSYSYDREKQEAIGRQLNAVLKQQQITGYSTENIWVIYSAFEPIARWEANGLIPSGEIEALKQKLNNPELWEISKGFEGVTFFLYTDKQKEKYINSEVIHQWTNEYFNLLKRYDEFDYFRRESYIISLDSKENFDTNYASNWYYYYK